MVRVNKVFCPAMALTGFAPPFANLANAAICGWPTQFETRSWSRLLSYATVCGLLNIGDGSSAGPLRITRLGTGSPDASTGYTVAEWLPKLETQSSLFFRSNATPVGFLI